ncbi:hypothetical protein [Microvirga sp. P5_D2]
MAAVFGIFSGTLDESHELREVANIRTGSTLIHARYFRIKLLAPPCDALDGLVSAIIRGAEGAIERVVFPEYEEIWDRRDVPALPENFIDGRVKEQEIDLCDCLPEYEDCEDACEAEALDIDPPVPSVGFMVQVRLMIKDLRPGTRIRAIVALSEDDEHSTERRRRARDVDASPAEDSANLSDVTVARDDTAGVDKS